MAADESAEAKDLEAQVRVALITHGSLEELFKYFVLSPKLLIATGIATAIFGISMGIWTYIYRAGDAVKI